MDKAPRHGWKLAWRQNYGDHSELYHRHSTTIFPEEDRDRLETISASVNEGFRLQDVPGGRPSIVQWVEWFEEDSEDYCDGNHWGLPTKRKRKDAANKDMP